jgi:hypothetical protein
MAVNLRGKQVEAFQEALLGAFSRDDLEQMLKIDLEEDLDEIVKPGKRSAVVFELIGWAERETRVEDLLAAALARRPKSEALRRFALEVAFTSSTPPAGKLEVHVLAGVGFHDAASWRARMEQVERCVCLVEIPAGRPIGTGFLVAPDVILTNYHVAKHAKLGEAGVVRFDHRKDAAGQPVPAESAHPFAEDWSLDESTEDDLDYAFVRLADRPGDARGVLKPGPHTFVAGEPVFILQHPSVQPLKLCVGSASDLSRLPGRISYTANTEGGSSGSPCCSLDWTPVALHHWGQNTGNRGIPLSTIAASLRARGVLADLGW